MELPTRFIEADEFKRLCELEVDPTEGELSLIMVYRLDAYQQAVWEDVASNRSTKEKSRHVDLIFLHAAEPCLYKDGDQLKIILPKYDDYGFDYWAQLLPVTMPWFYTVAPHGWDMAGNFDLRDAEYYFADD